MWLCALMFVCGVCVSRGLAHGVGGGGGEEGGYRSSLLFLYINIVKSHVCVHVLVFVYVGGLGGDFIISTLLNHPNIDKTSNH